MSARSRSRRRTRLAALAAFACAACVLQNGTSAGAARPPAPAPTRSLVGPGRDLEAGRLIAELAQATDDPGALERARTSGFAARALDRLDADASIAGDPRLFAATRAAFAAPPATVPPAATPLASAPPRPGAAAYASLIAASQRYLKRVDPRSARVTVLAELVAQIAFNASYDRDARADAIQRATLATIDDADYLDPGIGVERRALIDLPDGAWRAVASAALELQRGLDAVIGPRGTPTPPPFAAPRPGPAVPPPPAAAPPSGRGPAG